MYELTTLMAGFPGRSTCHGGLGWNTVALLQGHGETVLVDPGGYGYRAPLLERLAELGVERDAVTAVAVTHCHWDHLCNYTLFPQARVIISGTELDWAAKQPVGTWELPELHVERLAASADVVRVGEGDEPLPELRVIDTPGHTPGHVGFCVPLTDGHTAIFIGDAIKNEVEFTTGVPDMTLDERASRATIRRIRSMMVQDPELILVCGHDRQLSLVDGAVVAHTRLEAGMKIWTPARPTTASTDLLDGIGF